MVTLSHVIRKRRLDLTAGNRVTCAGGPWGEPILLEVRTKCVNGIRAVLWANLDLLVSADDSRSKQNPLQL
jgi:hypothetical protein